MTRTFSTVFGSATRLRGRLTLPGPAESGSCGVVVVGPFGHPYVCSYRPLRVLAERLAADGRPVLRFDWPGQGDSADPILPISWIETWTRAVRDAVAHLQAATGVAEVALVGLRIGATIAMTVASDPAIAGVALLAPFVDGRSYLRETRAFEALTGVAEGQSSILPEGAIEASGFLIAGTEAAALRSLDLRTLEPSRLRGTPILVATPRGDDQALGLRETLGGGDLTFAIEPELTYLYEGTGRSAATPACRRLLASWLDLHLPAGTRRDVRLPSLETTLSLGAGVTETGVSIGRPGEELALVTCEPETRRGPWIVFLNAGAVHHVGPNRLWTSFGRLWARSGIASVRIDASSLGDSDPIIPADEASGLSVASLYTASTDRDVRAVLDWLADAHGADELVLIGLCSGAYFALDVGAADRRVVGVGLVNPRVLVWDDEHLALGASHALGEIIRQPSRWRAALMKRQRPSSRLAFRGITLRALDPGRERRHRHEVRGQLEALLCRGGRCHLALSRGDAGHAHLVRLLGEDLAAPLGVSHQLFVSVDHTFRPLWSHDALRLSLERHLALPVAERDERPPSAS